MSFFNVDFNSILIVMTDATVDVIEETKEEVAEVTVLDHLVGQGSWVLLQT